MATTKPENNSTEKIDVVIEHNEDVSPAALQSRFNTLRDLDEEQMGALNKRLLRRLDWRLMPTITIMFLLK